MRRILYVVPLVLALACNQNKEELTKALADAQSLAAEKDSLITEVLETSKFVNGVNEELAKARSALVTTANTPESGTPAERDRAARTAALERVQALVGRLNETEQRLEQSTQRARSLSGRNGTLLKQIEAYKSSIDSLQATALRTESELRGVIDSQTVQIASLNQDLDTTRAANTLLSMEKGALKDTVTDLTHYKNTVYYVAGTEEELIEKGVVVKEGKKFLFFGGKQLHPARTLDSSAFTPLDKTMATTIDLPANHEYKLVSRQDLAAVDSTSMKDGKVAGQLRIDAPETFWAPSKYLILVQN
jgi:predicted  nucleic acid-binding Zn-ribbon protein